MVFMMLINTFIFKLSAQNEINAIDKENVVDTIHGKEIIDNFRNLENLQDTVNINWLEQNNNHSEKIIRSILGYDSIRTHMIKTYDKNKSYISSEVFIPNHKIFYLKTDPKENYSKLFYKKNRKDDEKLIFDPKQYSSNNNLGKDLKINYFKPCWCGDKVAIGITAGDTEFSDILVLQTDTQEIILKTNKIAWPSALGGVKWNSSCNGIYYTFVPDADKKSQTYLFNTEAIFFDLNDKSNSSKIIFSKSNNPEIKFKEEDFPLIYYDYNKNKHLIGTIAGVGRYRDAFVSKIDNKDNFRWKKLFDRSDKIKRFYLLEDDLYFLSAKNSPNFSLCKTSISNPDFDNPQVIVKEYENEIISSFVITQSGIFFVKVENGVKADLMFVNKLNQIKKIDIPVPAGSISLKTNSPNTNDLWVTISGWSSDSVQFYFDIENNLFSKHSSNSEEAYQFQREEIIVEEVLVKAHDGNKIPLSIIYKNNTLENGIPPLLITAYGSYGTINRPRLTDFSSQWINHGGVYAVAHVRGGGEKGLQWHLGGQKLKKENTWKDVISCVEYLHSKKYSQPEKTAGWGASAGGIAVGKAVLERPELFSAAVITSGMLNTVRLESSPNGRNNAKEFGTIKIKEEFESLLNMDVYHSIKKNVYYPSFLVVAGFNDARVAPWQSAKFVAKLRKSTSSSKPILFSIDFESGHGRENSKKITLEKIARRLSFVLWQTGHPDYQPKN